MNLGDWGRPAAFTAVLTLGASCAETEPSSVLLRPGRYSLTLIGYDLTNVPGLPPCEPFGAPPEGKIINTPIVIAQDGDELVGRSESAQTGTLELRFRRADGSGRDTPVTGTIRGTAIDAGLGPSPAKPVQASISGTANGAAAFEGSVPQLTFGSGRIRGSIRYTNASGASGDCTVLDWTLNEGVR